MSLELEGILVKKLPEISGQSKTGNEWRKQEFVIETPGDYPKKVCMNVWGDRISQIQALSEGARIKVYFDVESREYKERWYTDVKAWKVETLDAGSSDNGGSSPAEDPFPNDLMGEEPDLPF